MTVKRQIVLAVYVAPGQPITAELWNRNALAINSIVKPRDLDAGVPEGELAGYFLDVTSETITSTRVENPDDSDQYVNVDDTTAFVVQPDPGLVSAILQGLPITVGNFTASSGEAEEQQTEV